MNSAAARSKRSRSAAGWLAVGTAASNAAARMRTPRLESDKSGETSGQSCAAETFASMSRAPMRTMGSGSDRPACARPMFAGESHGASSVIALARKTRDDGIGGDLAEQCCGIAMAGPRRVECLGVILQAFAVRPMPALDRRGGPFRGLIAVAIVAGIGRAELRRQVRPRDTEAVIVPAVDDHIGALRHVAGRASERRACRLMMVVRCGRILVGGMALKADAVAGRAKFRGMRLVAVAASDAGREHLALLERAVVVNLVQHLAIGVIEPAGQRGDDVGVR